MPGSITFSSGLDIESILSRLLYAERAPARSLEQTRSQVAAQAATLSDFEARLRAISGTVEALRAPKALEVRAALSSNPAVAGASAAPGTALTSLEVAISRLATTSSQATRGLDSPDELLPHGQFDIRIGASTVTVEVGPGSDTLESLRDAISASEADVRALVLHDGSSYRLSLTSLTSGAAGTIHIENVSNPELAAALDFNPTSLGQDASFQVNGLTFTRSSNQVSDLVPGLTLELRSEGSASVRVDADTAGSIAAIRAFVEAYNALTALVRAQLASSGRAQGPLASLGSVRGLQDRLRELVSRSVEGLAGQTVSLRQIGLELANDGSIQVNETALRSALEQGAAGPVLSLSGRATDSRIRFLEASRQSAAGSHAVHITVAAEKASVVGAHAIPATGLGQAETLTFQEGDRSIAVNLAAGQTLAEVVGTINQSLAGTGFRARASDDGSGRLQVQSLGYGSAASVCVISDVDAPDGTGIGTAGLADTGVDVEGSIGGEAASGVGRLLTSVSGAASGVSLEVRATPGEVGPGGSGFGDAVVSLGVAEALDRLLDRELGSGGGLLSAERSGLRKRQDRLTERIEVLDQRLADREVRLRRELMRADEALRRMQSLMQNLQALIR